MNNVKYLHGYIDGDGCLFESSYTNYTSFISTLSFCETFKEKIDKILNIESRINKKENVYKWVVKKQEYLEKFINWLYKDFEFGLIRKYNKHLKIKENILNNLNKN